MESDAQSESNSSFGDLNDSGDENDPTEKCSFGKQVFDVPQSFCVQEEVFNQVLSMDTWEHVLNDKHREALKKLLPTFPGNDDEEKNETLKKLFSGENFKFGNPVKQFFERLKDGFLAPDVADASHTLKKANFREYKNQQQHYFYRLLQEILISRKKLLDTAYTLPPGQPVKMQQFTAKPKDATLCERTRLRYFSLLQDLREECGEQDTSSEDENYPESSPPKVTRKHKKQLQILEASLSPEMTRITSTTALPPGYPGSGHFFNHCLDMIEVSEERYREMLLTHKQRRLTDSDHPELDVAKIDLDDMITRANIAKRPLLKIADSQVKKKIKFQDNSEKLSKAVLIDNEKIKVEVKSPVHLSRLSHPEDISFVVNGEKHTDMQIPMVRENEIPIEQKTIKVEIEEEPICDNRMLSPVPEIHLHPTCFFSLLRDIFCESAEQKLSATKLEERVRTWQDGPTPALFEWTNFQDTWSDLVSSSLKFLAGDLISILPENFVPFLDYKEKQQQWQWIGTGRDSEEQLYALCQHWLENKDDVSLDSLETSQGSPPPPRVTTVWTVRPTTDEEKTTYREQECIRYQNPHKAFTFKVHGYESVVGPVKGVYGKESGVNKAREHSLLISDRPPFVTILSLVRDAAARLPNGEGTRADICELLKDSQYLAPASDQQIHTVVSGALDRLHYEKDPCVKYDVNRKLWIYLHRNRTEEEFERIHQAQAAAAKARKAVQKNKLPKPKAKDVPRTPPSANISSTSENGVTLNVDVNSTISPISSAHSPRGGTSPRTQGSPKQSHPSSNRHLIRSLSMPSQANNKIPAPVIPDNYNNSRKQDLSQANLLTSSGLAQPIVSSHTPVCSPQQSAASNILPQFQTEGNNSRPPSQGSVQSLPSPKTVIANVNAAQFVSVGSLQVGSTTVEQAISSTNMSPCIGVLSVDMKPSSPSFVGQPPVLQPVLSHQTMGTTSALTCVTTAMSPTLMSSSSGTIPKVCKSFASQSLSSSKAVQGFQTIVIKQEPGVRPSGSISSLPLLSVEEISSSSDSTVMNTSPVVARLVHGSQLLSLSNIVAGTTSNALLKQGSAAIQNFKIQGGNFTQQMLPNSTINLLPATQISTATDNCTEPTRSHLHSRLPTRIALVSQDGGGQEATLISSASIIGSSTMFSVNQDIIRSAETKVSSSHKDLTEVKRITLSSQAGIRSSVSDISQIVETASAANHIVSSSMISSSSSNPSSSSCKHSSPVVIASQEGLKPLTSTYVVTTPITNASVIAAQQGVRTASPLNMRTLQGIKVIPVPQSLAHSNKGVRGTPLLARIITPGSGISLRSTVPSDLVHTHQFKSGTSVNIVHGLQSVPSSSHIIKTTQACTNQEIPSSQPFIIQVQAPKTSEEDTNL